MENYLITNDAFGIVGNSCDLNTACNKAKQAEYRTGHSHFIIKVKPYGATAEFCRDAKGTIGTTIFEAKEIAERMGLNNVKESLDWLYSACYHGLVTQTGEMEFAYANF